MTQPAATLSQTTFIIFGASGFIGSNLAIYLSGAKHLFLIDKVPALLSSNRHFRQLVKGRDNVTFKQLDCSRKESLFQYLSSEQIAAGQEDPLVLINCVAETRFSLPTDSYKKSLLAQKNIIDALFEIDTLRNRATSMVHFSTAHIYEPTQKNKKEHSDSLKPWHLVAEIAAHVEGYLISQFWSQQQEGKSMPKCVILRPAIAYGPGDISGLSPRIVCAATYAFSRKKMKLLWSPGMKINTVHVQDVCKAVWHVCRRSFEASSTQEATLKIPLYFAAKGAQKLTFPNRESVCLHDIIQQEQEVSPNSSSAFISSFDQMHDSSKQALEKEAPKSAQNIYIFNLADNTDLNQQKFNNILQEIFSISVGFYGMIISSVAKKRIEEIADTSNQMHMPLWEEMKRDASIPHTPLTPHIYPELIYNTPTSIDGSGISSISGFKYQHPQVTTDLVYQQIKYFQDAKLFPPFDSFKSNLTRFKEMAMTDCPNVVLDTISEYLRALIIDDEAESERATTRIIHSEHLDEKDSSQLRYKTKEYGWKHDRAQARRYKCPVVQMRVARNVNYTFGYGDTETTGEGWKVWIALNDDVEGYPRPLIVLLDSSGDAKVCEIGNL